LLTFAKSARVVVLPKIDSVLGQCFSGNSHRSRRFFTEGNEENEGLKSLFPSLSSVENLFMAAFRWLSVLKKTPATRRTRRGRLG
jgi:hypothetical protein